MRSSAKVRETDGRACEEAREGDIIDTINPSMMSVRTPSRRMLLLQSGARQCLQQPSCPSLQPRRTLFNFLRGKREAAGPSGTPTNPVLDQYLKRKPSASQPTIIRGDLAPSSIFDADRKIQSREKKEAVTGAGASGLVKIGGIDRNPVTMAAVLDPDPISRERWQRKMVIRDIRKGGRLSRPLFLKRTERESSSRSENMKTSVKKLGMLSRQIAGKTVDDAIVQMRFSKKKAARDVLSYLEYARDEAIVKRGMGLSGAAPGADASTSTSETPAPIEIQLKDGKRHVVTDKSKIYIDQAWVGRGPYGKLPDYRAKGKINIMHTPWTSLSLILKEEATRVREFGDREAKRKRQREKNVWHPLPDRPIQGQRQWFSW